MDTISPQHLFCHGHFLNCRGSIEVYVFIIQGYKYTSTTPTLEYKHPTTGNTHGIMTIYPIKIQNIIEIPLTVIQDHQLIYVHGLNVKETLNYMKNILTKIHKYGGQGIILIHPDYKIADHPNLYEDFINNITTNKNIKTLHEIHNIIQQCYKQH